MSKKEKETRTPQEGMLADLLGDKLPPMPTARVHALSGLIMMSAVRDMIESGAPASNKEVHEALDAAYLAWAAIGFHLFGESLFGEALAAAYSFYGKAMFGDNAREGISKLTGIKMQQIEQTPEDE